VGFELRLCETGDLAWRQAGFRGFPRAFCKQLTGARELGFPTAIGRRLSDKRAEPLTTVDDAVAFKFFVRTFDGDDADE